MKKYLHTLSLILFFFFPVLKVHAQETVLNGASTNPISFADESVISKATYAVAAAISVGQSPRGLSTHSDGTQIYETNNGPAISQIITATTATGNISACSGTASVSPSVQQFTVSGSSLTGDITATAPTGFEVSLEAGSGYGNSVTLVQTSGTVGNTVVYVRSAANATVGSISGNVTLTSSGANSQNVGVIGKINALPTVNAVSDQIVNNGTATAAVNFTGTDNAFTWVNDTPGIGLAASGTGNISSFIAVNNQGSAVKATITVTPAPGAFAYIANYFDGTVSVVNTVTNNVVATIPVGTEPISVSVSPDGSMVYVGNLYDDTISVINTLTGKVVATIGGTVPEGIAVSPDGSLVYVADSNGGGRLTVINAATNTVMSHIQLYSGSYGVAVSPDGSQVYVVNILSNNVSIINTAANTVTATIGVGSQPTAIAVSPDGSKIYVTNQGSSSISVISTKTNTVVSLIATRVTADYITISPDGGKLYVSGAGSSTVSVINTSTNSVIASIPVTGAASGVSISQDGSRVYVTNGYVGFSSVSNSNTVSVINTATNTVVATIPVGSHPASYGNFVAGGTGCAGVPVKFTITVNAGAPPTIITSTATGIISACTGSASSDPSIQQFKVSGNTLTGNLSATAPAGFEISLVAGSGYGRSLTLTQAGGIVNSTVVYVRSAANAAIGNIAGNVTMTSSGATSQNVAVTGTVNALPTVNTVADEIVNNSANSTAVNFTGTGNTFLWTNDTQGVGLAASGTGNIAPFTAVNTGTAPVKATITVTPESAGFAYITDQKSNNISVINTITNAVVATVPVGENPTFVAASPDGSMVYVANNVSETISVINATTNKVVSTIPIGQPNDLAVSPDGAYVYVANYVSNTIGVIKAATNTIITNIPVGSGPGRISISRDGKEVFVTNQLSNTVSVISTLTNAVVATIPVGTYPVGLSVSPDGAWVYAANFFSNNVSVINTGSNMVVTTINVGTNPNGVSISPDGKLVYITNYGSNTVSVINTATNIVTSTIATGVGTNPINISVSPDGSLVYVVNQNTNNVSVINALTNVITGTIAVGPMPGGIAVTSGTGCSGTPAKFSITVNPSVAFITIGTVSGSVSACAGTASVNPNIQQFTISGSNLTGDITAVAPNGFELSLAAGSGYGSSVSLSQTSGTVSSTLIYVRSASTAQSGNVSGNVTLTSTGAADQQVAVAGTINAVSTVNAVASQTVINGAATTAVSFTGTDASTFNWVNDTPGMGLAAGGIGNITSFNGINNGSTPVTATITVTPVPVGFAYIANSADNNVSVINISTNNVVATIPVGKTPYGVSVSPDGSRVYVANRDDNNVSVINTITNKVIATILVGTKPIGILVSPDGQYVYVANSVYGGISVISTATNSVTSTLLFGEGPGLAISRDGSLLYVANQEENNVNVINTITKNVISTIATASYPSGLCLSPDGSKLYITNLGTVSGNLTVINTSDNSVLNQIPLGYPEEEWISPDGSKIYIANSYNVIVIDAVTKGIIATIPVGASYGISGSSDGTEVYVTNIGLNNVSVISTATNTIISTISVGTKPYSFGNFIASGLGCIGTPVKFTITVNPTGTLPPTMITSAATGAIYACAGNASESPSIQQFTVSGGNLTGDITANAPTGFEISLNPESGFAGSVTLKQTSGAVSNSIVYVRSSANASEGSLSGTVVLSSPGIAGQSVSVIGTVYASPTINQVDNQIVNTGAQTAAVNFSGTASVVSWVNDTPSIGLAASGTGNIVPFNAVNTSHSPVTATITATAVPGGFAYIANQFSNNVSVINTITNTVVATINVGSHPTGVSVSPDGSRVYVTNNTSNTVSVINTSTNTVISTITVGSAPYGIIVSRDGSRVYVANSSSNTVSVINTATNTVIAAITVGSAPGDVAVSPDGSRVYVTNSHDGSISVINTTTNTVLSSIQVDDNPSGVLLSPDGSRLYVAGISSSHVTVINTATNAIITTIAVSNASSMAISPDGSILYVVGFDIAVINTEGNNVIRHISVNSPYSVSLNQDGSLLYATEENISYVAVFNTATYQFVASAQVGSNPVSFGNFVTGGSGCSGTPVKFTIKVNSNNTLPPAITASPATGAISACAGTASASPNIQQFTVSGGYLVGDIIATAPTGFEISLSAASGYSGSLTLTQIDGSLSSTVVYVRSANNAPTGSISGVVTLTSAGATDQTVAVFGAVNALPTVNAVANQIVDNGATTTAVSFTGTANAFTWVNDTPGIGLAASGSGNINAFTAINTGTSPVTATITTTPVPSGFAYMTDPLHNSVSVVSTADNMVVAKIPVGDSPVGVAISPDGSRVYVTNSTINLASNSYTMSEINTATNTVVATVQVGPEPYGIALSPDGKLAYIAVSNFNFASNCNLEVWNTSTNTIVKYIPIGINPAGVAISPDGTRVYVANSTSGSVSVINTATNTVIADIAMDSPVNMSISPNGKTLFVSNLLDGYISVVDLSTNTVTTTIAVGLYPAGVAISPDGRSVYVANISSNNVSVINTTTNVVTATIPVVSDYFGICVSPDGSRVYVGSSVINTATNQVIATVPVPNGSLGNFISKGTGCNGTPIKFTITVNPLPPAIIAGAVTGSISACSGSASVSPNIQQFTVSGSYLTGNITAVAPAGFEISLTPASGYGSNLTLMQTSGSVSSTVIYVRSATTLQAGTTTGDVMLTSPGAAEQDVAVTGMVNQMVTLSLTISTLSNNICAGAPTTFTATPNDGGDTPNYQWLLNGNNVGTNSASFTSSTLSNADVVSCKLSTNAPCVVPADTTSNSITMTVLPIVAPSISIAASANNICSGTPITFTATATNGGSSPVYQWLVNGADAGTNSPVFSSTALADGDVISCSLTNNSKCAIPADTTSNSITMMVNPLPTVDAGKSITINDGSSTKLDATATGNISDITWSPATGLSNNKILEPIASPTSTTTYMIAVQTAAGCVATDTLTVTVFINIIIPNTFTPNGDGVNDTWNIKYLDTYPDCSVKIFNRYGQMVYSSVGYETPWDGRYGGANLPQGTYYYIINLRNGGKTLSGSITIIR